MDVKGFGGVKSQTKNAWDIYLFKQVVTTFASSLLCLSAGLTHGISAVLLQKLLEDEQFHWKADYGPWLAAGAPISSVFGCLCAGPLLDRFGRKAAHIAFVFPFVVGWITMAFANNCCVMLAGRFTTGFSFGAVRPTVIIYLGEISDPKYRGILLLFPSLAVNLGILLSHVIGTVCYWRTSLLICTIPNIILLVMLFFFKESPYWLISKGRVAEGTECFKWFRGEGELAENELRDVLEKQKGKTSSLTFKELQRIVFSRSFVRPLVTVFFIFLTVQMCGINAFPFYADDLLRKLFETEVDTFLLMMVVDLIRVGMCIVICLFSKMMHRKATFLSCAYGTTLLLTGLVIFLTYKTEESLIFLPLTLIVLYIGIASAIATLGWTFVAELFPNNVRGLGSGLSGVICFSLLSVCVKITPDLLACGEPILYGTFAVITLVCAVVLNVILPETNGKRLQEIEDSYNDKNKTTTL